MPDLITVIVELPNGISYSHTGTMEAIDNTKKKFHERHKIKLTVEEQRETMRKIGKIGLVTPVMLESAIEVWTRCKDAKTDYDHMMAEIMRICGVKLNQARRLAKRAKEMQIGKGKHE